MNFHEYIVVNEKGHLEIDGCDCVDIAADYDTPLFVISENQLRYNCRLILNAFKSRYRNIIIYFEHKCNNGLAIRRILQQEGIGADACGLGELYVALMGGVHPDKIMLGGGNKTEVELKTAIEAGILINVSNLDELIMLDEIAAKLGKVPDIAFRVKAPFRNFPDRSKKRHSRPFGFAILNNQAHDAFEKALKMKNVNLVGLQCHIGGSDNTEFNKVATGEIMDFVGEMKKMFGWEPKHINMGGGFLLGRKEVPHGPNGKWISVPTIDEYAEAIVKIFKEKIKEYDLSEPTLTFEPGRFIASSSGILLCKVGNVNYGLGSKKWVHVDASHNQLLRMTEHNHYYHTVVANKADIAPQEVVDIVGPLIASQDLIGKDRKLPKTQRGDLIAFLDVGGYAEANDCSYEVHPRPATILVNDGKVDLVRRKETIQDILVRDIIPPRLILRNHQDELE